MKLSHVYLIKKCNNTKCKSFKAEAFSGCSWLQGGAVFYCDNYFVKL